MSPGPTSVLVLGHDTDVLGLLEFGLPRHLDDATVVAAASAEAALRCLAAEPIDVLVIDLAPAAFEDLQVLAAARAQYRGLPVVVLSGAESDANARTSLFEGRVCVVHKPATVPEIARAVLEAFGQPIRGHMRDVELAPLLRLLNLERTSCTLRLRSGGRSGQLDLIGGEIVDASSDELATGGRAAALALLTWDRVRVDFERSAEGAARRIETPLEALLIEAARSHDEALRRTAHGSALDTVVGVEAGNGERLGSQGASAGIESGNGGAHVELPHGEQGDGAIGVHLDAALSALTTALTDLRAQLDATGRVLEAAAPWFERLDASMRGRALANGCPDEAQLAGSWRELVTVTERLARAAEALTAPPVDSTL